MERRRSPRDSGHASFLLLPALGLLAAALVGRGASYPDGLPPFSRALGRPLAWDPYGAYGLDAEGPLSKADADVLAQVEAGELGRAEALCRDRLKADGNAVLPAWVLGQIVRVRRNADEEYRRIGEGQVLKPASPAVLLYRLHVCRLAFEGTMRPPASTPKFDRRQVLAKKIKALCDLLRPAADRLLGVAVAVTAISPSYALDNRATLESYRRGHPKGPDVRPLLCQAYNGGVKVVSRIDVATGKSIPGVSPDEPQPKKAMEVARSILQDRPNDAFGHFHAGRSYARLGLPKSAKREMQAALDAGGLPPLYASAARQYVETENDDAFLPKAVVY